MDTDKKPAGLRPLAGLENTRHPHDTVLAFPSQRIVRCQHCEILLSHDDRERGDGYCAQCAAFAAQSRQRALDRAALESGGKAPR